MPKSYTREFLFQAFALIIVALAVHAVYVAVIRPRADAFLEAQAVMMAENPDYVARRSGYVVLKDYEQEACFVLFFWALAIMAYKGTEAVREHRLLQKDIIPLTEGMAILPEDARDVSRHVEALPDDEREALLPRCLLAALHRFGATGSIQDVSAAAREVCETESERLDSELSMIRYIAWAIPSIGFIGTVRGIGDALGQAHKAVEGDITGVTESLGVAFNSTLVALLISIVLMFIIHQLQRLQERLVLDTETYCDRNVIRRLAAREQAGA